MTSSRACPASRLALPLSMPSATTATRTTARAPVRSRTSAHAARSACDVRREVLTAMRAKGAPKPSPGFEPPTNTPQPAPTTLPEWHSVRVMPPTEQYPNGYWRQYSQAGQAADPSTGKPPGNVAKQQFEAQTHVPLPSKE